MMLTALHGRTVGEDDEGTKKLSGAQSEPPRGEDETRR